MPLVNLRHLRYAILMYLSLCAPSAMMARSLSIQVLADYVDNSELQSYPLRDVGVYAGYWQAGDRLGFTDADGRITVDLDESIETISVFKMTSSHTALRDYIVLPDDAFEQDVFEFHIAPQTVSITADYETSYGQALYITGESSYLGDWQTASKLTYNQRLGRWQFNRNLPLGARFKLLLADWTDDEVIDLSQMDVTWQQGTDLKIVKTNGYYQTVLNVRPEF